MLLHQGWVFFWLMFFVREIFSFGVWFVVLPKKILYEAAPNSVSHQYDKVENTGFLRNSRNGEQQKHVLIHTKMHPYKNIKTSLPF